MKALYLKFGICFLFVIGNLLFGVPPVRAIYDPLALPNNRVGVHILEPTELNEAAKLINSKGGDWGYVTIPIRSDDRNPDKWLPFFKSCASLHVIPIIRLATYHDGGSWAAPTAYDLVDFANFLAEMPWPTQNRYVILFNEPNHSQEWGNSLDPDQYATLLIQAKAIFKSRSAAFFLISAGLDMSAPTSATSIDALAYYRLMSRNQPGWYSAVDGLSFHAYPNPGFSAPITSAGRYGPKSYLYEIQTLRALGYADKPVFITETGNISGTDIYTPGFTSVWTEPEIVAITPFLLFAGAGNFLPFSLLDLNHQPRPSYLGLYNLPKSSGSPLLNPDAGFHLLALPAVDTPYPTSSPNLLTQIRAALFPPPPRLTISGADLTNLVVEIADTPAAQTQGLSDRKNLPSDHGLLFVFPDSRPQTFWMKDMLFPLDFIWINAGRIAGINENVLPPAQTGGQPLIIPSLASVNWVLEVNSGFIARHHIQVGDTVTLIKN